MKRYYCNINITSEEIKKYYLGLGFRTRVTDQDGLTIDLPTNLLIPHITNNGIHGKFCISNNAGKTIITRT